MKCFTHLVPTLVAFFMFYFLFLPQNAYAYLDLGTGSFLIQMAVAALFGALFTMKQFWERIKIFFKNIFSKR